MSLFTGTRSNISSIVVEEVGVLALRGLEVGGWGPGLPENLGDSIQEVSLEPEYAKQHAHVQDGNDDEYEVGGPQLVIHAALHHPAQLLAGELAALEHAVHALVAARLLLLGHAGCKEGWEEDEDHDSG